MDFLSLAIVGAIAVGGALLAWCVRRLAARGKRRPGPWMLVTLNARLQPFDRGTHFEDPLDEALQRAGCGRVTGGGSSLGQDGIDSCDLEIDIAGSPAEAERMVIEQLEALGAPKGSVLRVEPEGRERRFGSAEGLAVFLNGTDLPAEVYATSDVNFVVSELARLLGDEGRVLSHWEGRNETALFLYGASFEAMQAKIEPFLASYPLCQRARVVRIA